MTQSSTLKKFRGIVIALIVTFSVNEAISFVANARVAGYHDKSTTVSAELENGSIPPDTPRP